MLVHRLLTSPDSTLLKHDVLLNKCVSLLKRDRVVEVKKIYREENFVSNGVSN